MFDFGYTYKYLRTEKEYNYDTDVSVHIYTFISPKTNKEYNVRIEDLGNDTFALKYYLKESIKNKNRYKILTKLNEPTQVFRTCIDIMLEFINKKNMASFIIVGEASEDEDKKHTQRYRIYEYMFKNFFSVKLYEHYILAEHSIYVLSNRNNTLSISHIEFN